jgi:hypothetical protein
MLLGQLYHYDSLLETFPFPLTSENAGQLELFGVEHVSKSTAREVSRQEIQLELRDVFSKTYTKILEENELNTTAQIWHEVTSPLTGSGGKTLRASKPLSTQGS